MGYSTYWSGELFVTPELTSQQRRTLSFWLNLANYNIPIEDDKLTKRMLERGFKHHLPWSPVDSIDAGSILFCTESGEPHVVALIIQRLIEKLPNNTVSGEVSWDGDEKEDIGMIVVEEGKVWLCPATIVYAIPGSKDAELIA